MLTPRYGDFECFYLYVYTSSEKSAARILKVGMLISAMVGIDTRGTMDMDATIKGQTLTAPEITAIVEEILAHR